MNLIKTAGTFFKRSGRWIGRHAPVILTSVGVGGSITAVVLAIKATPKAMLLIEKRKKEENKEKLTVLETVDTTWKTYSFTVGTMIFSVAAIIGAQCLNARQQAMLIGLCSAKDGIIQKLQDKITDVVEPEEAKTIRKEVNKELINEHPDIRRFQPESGDYPCLDTMTGQIFSSNREKLEIAELKMRDRLRTEISVSKNSWLDMLGERPTGDGDELGWQEGTDFEILVSTEEIEDLHMPAYAVTYVKYPVKRFDRLD